MGTLLKEISMGLQYFKEYFKFELAKNIVWSPVHVYACGYVCMFVMNFRIDIVK